MLRFANKHDCEICASQMVGEIPGFRELLQGVTVTDQDKLPGLGIFAALGTSPGFDNGVNDVIGNRFSAE
jgi:hypothetical protein